MVTDTVFGGRLGKGDSHRFAVGGWKGVSQKCQTPFRSAGKSDKKGVRHRFGGRLGKGVRHRFGAVGGWKGVSQKRCQTPFWRSGERCQTPYTYSLTPSCVLLTAGALHVNVFTIR